MKAMLASKWEARNENMFPFWAQPKLDGIRCLMGVDGYGYTRSLKPVRNTVLQSKLRQYKSELAGLDGEIIVGDPWAPDCYVRTSSAVMSFENDDIENAKFHVFDVWNSSENYTSRHDEILERMDSFPDFVEVVPTTFMWDMEMLKQYEEQMLLMGHEGVILRQGNEFYKFGRGTPKVGQLIKMKRFDDAEGKVIAVHELMHNDNPATIGLLGQTERSGHKENLVPMNTLGAIEVELTDEKWQSRSVRIGTGFPEATRQHFWNNRASLIGKIVKYKYFQPGSKDAPRFPVFLGLRDPDDISDDGQGSLF